MTSISLYNPSNTLIVDAPVCEGSQRRFEVMKEDSIVVVFTSPTLLSIPVGSYCTYDSLRWEVTEPQSPRYNESTGGYEYSLVMECFYRSLKNKIFKFIYTAEDLSTQKRETSWTITGSMRGTNSNGIIATALEKALKDISASYRVSVNPIAKLKEVRSLTFESCSIIDAMTLIAEAYECEWWFEASAGYNTFKFGKKGGSTLNFVYGTNLSSLTIEDSTDDYTNRIYAFGSDKNLPASYDGENDTTTGVSEKRLRLPKNVPTGVTLAHHLNTTLGCLDMVANQSSAESVEKVVIFEDIYPKHIGEVGSIETYTAKDSDGETHTYYRFRDASASAFEFKKEYLISGEKLMVQFESGSLNGLTFECKFNPKGLRTDGVEDQLYEIVANTSYGIELPNTGMTIAEGDEFVLYGWDSSRIEDLGLVAEAEKELLLAVDEYLSKNAPKNYTCTLFAGSVKPSFGDSANITYPTIGSTTSRVIGFTRCLDLEADIQTIKCGEVQSYSRIGSLEASVTKLETMPVVNSMPLATTTIIQCESAQGEAVKTIMALSDNEEDIVRQRYLVQMEHGNTANAVTLKVGVAPAYPLYYRGAQASATNTWSEGEILDLAYNNGHWETIGNSQAVNTTTCHSVGGEFVVEGVTLNASSLGNCRFVIKFDHKVTATSTNGLVYLSIGGLKSSVVFEGSDASITNTWRDGATLDVWYYGGQWHCSPTDYPHVSYEVWSRDIEKITKPNN